jgi:phosphoglycerate dehydrogenase-like enzyme
MVDVVAVSRLTPEDIRRIRAVDPRINLVDAGTWWDGEIIETWPPQVVRNFVGKPASDVPPKAERDAALAMAEIIAGGYPYPLDLRKRSPRLKWFHQRNAGANNLWHGDLWKSDVMVTTSRGQVGPAPIGEYAVAAALYAARDFGQAERDRAAGKFDRTRHNPMVLFGRTVCIVGAGGIGREAGKRFAALGMTVLGVRRRAAPGEPLPEGFTEMLGADRMLDAFARSHVVVVACQLTEDTKNLMNAAAFAAMPKGAVMVNVARGEIVDEAAMLDSLDAGHLKGAVLDVYAGETDGPPPPRLWTHPKVLVTPHNSGRGAAAVSGVTAGVGINIFCDNLRAYLDGKPLANVIEWSRGY